MCIECVLYILNENNIKCQHIIVTIEKSYMIENNLN